MKKILTVTLTILTIFLSFSIKAQVDSVFIEGPSQLCPDECGEYTFYVNGVPAANVNWIAINGSFFTDNPITVCGDIPGIPGTYELIVTETELQISSSFTYTILESDFIEIESTASNLCPASPDEECETVCAGTSVTYTVPTSTDVDWSISGSDDYEINGNSVTVNWEDPGLGSVDAFSFQTTDTIPSFVINCGQYYPAGDFGFGSGYVYINGNGVNNGNDIYEITVSSPNGNNITLIGTEGFNAIDQLFSGPYAFEVTSVMTGETQYCEFFVQDASTGCYLAAFPEIITQPLGCGECNGGVFVLVEGGTAPYSYTWSNGSTSQFLEGVCAGTHTVTVTDSQNCQTVQIFNLYDQEDCGSTGCSVQGSICVEILEQPIAQFTSTPPPINNTIEICEGQTIYFENQSTGGETYIWDFGDFNTSVQLNPEHTYENPGTYDVSLIVRNECFCSDTTSMTVLVIDADIPEIGCVGTICEGESVTYSAPAGCDTFYWSISSNGTIADGGGTDDDFVTVNWGNGPSGTVELAVDNCTGDVCTLPNIAFIPIISDDALIEGPNQVCNNSEVIYSLPKYDGTEYVWTVSNFGTIKNGQGTNRITVEWNGAVPNTSQSVDVFYENCYLECGGSDQLSVSILPEFFIQGTPAACEGSEAIFYGKNAITGGQASLNWELTAPDGSSSYTSLGASISEMIPFNSGAGTYTLTGTPGIPTDYCTDDYELEIVVQAKPDTPTSIEGETNVCAGEPYSYSATTSLATASFVWEINDGGTITTQEGNPINVVWSGSGDYTVSVAQINTEGLNCQSDFISLTVNPIGTITVTGDDDLCLEETTIYSATDLVGVDYLWTVTPSEAGTIASGQGSNEVEIFWTNDGNATLTLSVCGQNEVTNVLVRPKPVPVVNHPVWLCANETASISTTILYDSYIWNDEFGLTISNSATPDLGSGFYDVIVTNEFGCTENISFEIRRYPPPSVHISTPNFSDICPMTGDPFPTFYAEDTNDGYSFAWYHDNVAVGTDSPIYTATGLGTYWVIVTDLNGCTATSNIAHVNEDCDGLPGGGGQCSGGGGGGLVECDDSIEGVTFDINLTPECNTLEFVSTTTNEIDIQAWYFDDGTSSTDDSPIHTFDNAGFYRVILNSTFTLNGQEITCAGVSIATVPVAANFDIQSACPGEEVILTDLSTFIPGESIVSHSWDFGDPSSPDNTSTLPVPTHIYDAPGSYTVTLTITSGNGCSSTKTQTVQVYDTPTVTFSEPVVNCAATSLEFIANVSSNVTEVEWNFGDPSSNEANTATAFTAFHTFENPGVYSVILTGTNIYGCSEIYTYDVTVEPNNLTGLITAAPSSTLCDGDIATLTAPSGGISWLWSTGETTVSISVATANVYEVTVTDDNGCTYSPPGMPVDVLPLPEADIFAVELDEFGNPINYNFDTQEVCEGEDVYLQIEENANYSYSWSTGSVTTEEEFSEERGNQLTEGVYDISVNMTDINSGCTNISVYQVIVHGVPQNVTIISDMGTPICANSGATLSVQSPNANYDYVWNTGEIGTTITIIAGGEYWVTAYNEFGCEGESNHIFVENAPDIDKIPDGCHTRCQPDTICLPNMPTVSSYQWYFNGTAVPAPEGTIANFIAQESGEYYVVMEDIFGCSATSDILTLDLYIGFGTIEGEVYLDVNENGVIDGGDQLVEGLDIQLLDENGVLQNTITSNTLGAYSFPNIPSVEYNLELDTLTMPELSTYTVFEINQELIGCDDEEIVNWLLIPFCPEESYTESLVSCDGNPIIYDGAAVPAGTSMDFNYLTVNGCDSIITVDVVNGFTPEGVENYTICSNETLEFNGITFYPSDSETITFTNQYGCDSIVGISVDGFPEASFTATAKESCWNATDGKITIEAPTGGVEPYEFALDGVTWQEELEFESLIGGDYTVAMRDANGCEYEYEIEVPLAERLEVQTLDQIMGCSDEDVNIEAYISGGLGDITYEWNNGVSETEIRVEEVGTYTFTAVDECGTVSAESIVANEIDTRLSLIYIPNAFSPNNDGINDLMQGFPATNIEVLSYHLMIFDRWGNMMADIDDVNQGWDGTKDGVDKNNAVFTYMVSATVMSCGIEKDIVMQGDVTLLR